MPLSIKNNATERLARQVARETGESLTKAIQRALEERWERLKTKRRSRALTGQVEDLLRRVDALPNLDSRPPDEILGYDEHGMPR
jgi:antitoxin VapB